MKNLILLLLTTFTLSCCNKDDDNKPKTELEKLPLATQTGAQTFGCLIDGKAFVPPKFGTNAPNAFYQFVGGEYTLSIYGSTDGGPTLKSINIGCLDMPLIQETSYLLKEELTNNYFGEYNIGGGITFSGASTTAIPGTLTITRFDPSNFIISGTFEFTVLDDNGAEIKITNGRFDMQYTN
ncbi:MAG: hypothetical protein IM568_00035 [Flavobacterium sp.]|jgi:hypothetical protein|nr:hypothetical protein [Flavobacterium sp.]